MTHPTGTAVSWTDSNNKRHTDIVTEFPDPPPGMADRVYVVETVTVELPYWVPVERLTEAPQPVYGQDAGT